VRAPTIEVSGISCFESFEQTRLYPLMSTPKKVCLDGYIRFDVMVSDVYTFARNINIGTANIKYDPPLVSINELHYLPYFVKILCFNLFILLIILGVIRNRKLNIIGR